MSARYCSNKCRGIYMAKNLKGKNNPNWKARIKVLCLVCEKAMFLQPNIVKRGSGKFCSTKCKGIWMTDNRVGPKSSNWKGGITPENLSIRTSSEYLCWKHKVLKRDNYTCQKCGQIGGKIHVHHVNQFAKFPELRMKLKNGVTLCEKCHKLEHKRRK